MTMNILLAGFGGQGILFAGKALAKMAMDAELQVSWLPSYGPEMRGGAGTGSTGNFARRNGNAEDALDAKIRANIMGAC